MYRYQLWVAQECRPTIVFMGCSCTQFGLYPSAFQERLDHRHPGHRLTVANFGVGGYTTFQGMRQLERDVLPLRPRAVAFYYGWNDHWDSYGIEDKDIGRFHQRHKLLFKLGRLTVTQSGDVRPAEDGRRMARAEARRSLPDRWLTLTLTPYGAPGATSSRDRSRPRR